MKRDHLMASLLAFAALCLYLPGIAREAVPGDGAVYLRRAYELHLDSFAQTHSLFLALAHLAMRGLWFLSPPTAAGALSASFAALTVGLIYRLLRQLGGGMGAATFAAGSLAVSHGLWFHAVFPEVYTLNAACLAAMIYCAIRWQGRREYGGMERGVRPRPSDLEPRTSNIEHRTSDLGHRTSVSQRGGVVWLGAALFSGALGCANHMLAGIALAVCFGWALWLTLRRGWPFGRLIASGAIGSAGFIPLFILLWRDAGTVGWPMAVRMALVGGSGITGEALVSYGEQMGTLGAGQLARSLATMAVAGLYNFPSPAGLAIAIGVAVAWRRRSAAGGLLLSLALAHAAFAATYAIHEAWAFFLPVWIVAAILAGLGFERLRDGLAALLTTRAPGLAKWTGAGLIAVSLAAPVAVYAAAPAIVLRLAKPETVERMSAGRLFSAREYFAFYLFPPKANAHLEADWLRQTMRDLPTDAYLCLRPGYRALALYLQRVEDIRSDIRILGPNTRPLADALFGEGEVFADVENPLAQTPELQPRSIRGEALDNRLWKLQPCP